MTTRLESAAKTRRALLDAAAGLLDAGGAEAVTLREVGARAGVSRNAPYRHFTDKQGLLTAVAAEGWARLADTLKAIGARDVAPSSRLQQALMTLVELARKRPHLYQLMFIIPERDRAADAQAAAPAQEHFLSIVAGVVGEADALLYGILLFSSSHGVAGLEVSGHLTGKKWGISTEDLIATLVTLADPVHPRRRTA